VPDTNEQMEAAVTAHLDEVKLRIGMPGRKKKKRDRDQFAQMIITTLLTSFALLISPTSSRTTPSISLASAFAGC
jgi:hypothetical protein